MSNPMIRRWSKKILISILFVVSVNIVEVFGVVMMMPEPTIQCPDSPDEGIITQPLPSPYNISSPIITVPKYRFFKNIPETEWTHAWLYEAEDLMVFATQGADEMMQSRFVIDENIDSTEVHLYAVIDGYGGNFTTEYLSYVLMDRLRNKISNIKKGNLDDHLNSYVNPNGSINYNKLLHDEIMAAEKDLWKKISESKDKHSALLSKSGSALLIAVLDTDWLYVANVGDSRALMSSPEGVATRLTEVHDYTSNPKEKARVSNATSQHSWCHRPTISRAIGDFCYKRNAPYMIPDPQIFTYDLSKTHSKFILLATDWIWRGMGTISDEKKDQNIIKHVYEHFETYLLEAMINLSVRRHADNIHGHSRAMIAVRTVFGKKKTTVRKKLIF